MYKRQKSDIYMWNTISLGIIQLTTMLLLYPYGVHTMIIVYVSINICWLFVWHYFVWQQIQMCIRDRVYIHLTS